jgi:GntR family transcriptional regulator, carbon starvation induced regulator
LRHKEFHLLLLDRCGSSWLLGFCSTMMDQAVRYRSLSMNVHPSLLRREGAAAEHEALLNAAIDRTPTAPVGFWPTITRRRWKVCAR